MREFKHLSTSLTRHGIVPQVYVEKQHPESGVFPAARISFRTDEGNFEEHYVYTDEEEAEKVHEINAQLAMNESVSAPRSSESDDVTVESGDITVGTQIIRKR